MSSCNKKGDWNYCQGGRKFKILDKDKNIMKIIYSDGSSYEGIIKDRLKHGTGLFKWKNGDFYNGNWENDNLNGIGTFNFASGDKYIGNYVDGLRHGYGNYTFADGTVLEGIFEKGKFKHKKTKPISISNSKLDRYKSFCSEIGFVPGTEKFGECVLEAMKKG